MNTNLRRREHSKKIAKSIDLRMEVAAELRESGCDLPDERLLDLIHSLYWRGWETGFSAANLSAE